MHCFQYIHVFKIYAIKIRYFAHTYTTCIPQKIFYAQNYVKIFIGYYLRIIEQRHNRFCFVLVISDYFRQFSDRLLS